MKRLVAIVGPTAIGKTRLAILLASRFNGEIIGADSRQLYRHMDIGTAKPSRDERAAVPHHLIDILEPDKEFSLARFQDMAYQTIDEIIAREKIPFLVGGTGLYIKAVIEGWRIPRVTPDSEFRYNKEKQAARTGAEALYRELVAVDPEAAGKIEPGNIRRIIRALEVYENTGELFSGLGGKESPDFTVFTVGLTAPRDILYRIADDRVDEMMRRGLVDEVEKLRKMGYDEILPSMSGIGYRQVGQYLDGKITLEEAVRTIKTVTHRFIRRQYAWFRLSDENIHWYDRVRDSDDRIIAEVAGFLNDTQVDD